jgi:hypothetical protein
MTDSRPSKRFLLTRFLKDKKALFGRHQVLFDSLQAILEFGTFLFHVLHLLFDREDLVFRLGKITLNDKRGLQIEDGPPWTRIPPTPY